MIVNIFEEKLGFWKVFFSNGYLIVLVLREIFFCEIKDYMKKKKFIVKWVIFEDLIGNFECWDFILEFLMVCDWFVEVFL